jgi:hypothetical protein
MNECLLSIANAACRFYQQSWPYPDPVKSANWAWWAEWYWELERDEQRRG